MATLAQSYAGAARIVRRYWTVYGGWAIFLRSPYMHFSLILALATHGTWTQARWWEQVLAVLPNLLGFSLGGLAIFLGFGSEQFRNMISGREADAPEKESPYLAATAAFAHFIVVQLIGLLAAILCAGFWALPTASEAPWAGINEVARIVLWLTGYWLFLYAICSAGAALFAVFRVASWFDEFRTNERRSKEATAPERDARRVPRAK